MMVPPLSRRTTLRFAGVGLTALLPGCSILADGGARYSLLSSPAGGTTLTDLFAWEPRRGGLHVRYHLDALTAELLDSGTLATEAQPIGPYDSDTEPTPAYVEHDGAYYRVRVTDVEDVSLDRWEFWFEPTDEPPSDADPVENPDEGLSDLDADVVEWAAQDAIRAIVNDDDRSAASQGERGVVYFEPMDPDDSDLVPDPPFEYVQVEPDTEFLSEKQTLRAHAEKGSVETRRYVHETEQVAESESELREILIDHIDATFDDASPDVRDILEETSGGTYAERDPISESFERLIERLGIEDASPPDESGASRAWRRHYEYGGNYYATTLRVRND
ncbi:hypothetical protein [Halorussus amylolyticus]|uniref:hypothetical protein n=1 Tax=Halorussus amylolyticus TaxID=1126242 RepID=UPI0010465456|nr:hypothetical protein [Halorussus amylolyticus]